MSIRSVFSRVYAFVKRTKPCGCVYPSKCPSDSVPNAHRVDDRVTDAGEYIVEYQCEECESTFELRHGAFIEREVN